MWVPPLRLERRLHFSRFNPFFKHGEWQAWIAYRNNRARGRISAQIDQLHRERYGADTGHFGLLEGIEDAEVFAALMHTAEEWLAARRHQAYQRPVQFIHQSGVRRSGGGFRYPPDGNDAAFTQMVCGHYWKGQGYRPLKDMLAYWVEVDFKLPD